MNAIWTLAEADGSGIRPVSYEVIARAVALKNKLPDGKVVSVLVGPPAPGSALSALIRRGADEVLSLQSPELASPLVHRHAAALASVVAREKPLVFLAAATTYGRTVMPYLAAKFYAGLTADCTSLDIDPETGNLLQTRPAIGGNILATIHTPTARPQMATVRPHSTQPLPEGPTICEGELAGRIRIEEPTEPPAESGVEYLGFETLPEESVDLADAQKIVSGGRGLRREEGFSLVRELAQLLTAAVGASREAVDRGWISYPHQVGLSGKTVSPELYLALGISGSIQHMAGMQTSKYIVAVDSDPDAPIFRIADLAVQGDLYAVVPALCDALRKRAAEREASEER